MAGPDPERSEGDGTILAAIESPQEVATKAKELMTKSPKTCEPHHDLSCALRIMEEEDCGIIPITEGNGDERIVGIVTDRDIALHLGSVDARPSAVKIRDVMTTDLVSCEPNAEADEISRKMQAGQVRRIVVVEDGRLLGVIAIADLARASGSREGLGRELQRVVTKVWREAPGRARRPARRKGAARTTCPRA